jgi:predicted porin
VAVQPTPAIAGAGGLTVRIGGYFAFAGAYIQDDWDRARSRNTIPAGNVAGAATVNNAQARQRTDFRNDMELNVFIDGRASNGMTYGAVLEFQMDNVVATAGDGTTVSFDEMYGFITLPNLGTLRFGQEDNAASLLQVRAPASAALGGDAEWDEFIVQTGLADGSPYVISGINDGNDATKIIYLSPQFAGFDFGLSYAANSNEGERTNVEGSTTQSQRDFTGLTNEYSVGVRYRGTFGAIGVQAGVGAMWAESPRQNAAGTALGAIGSPRAQSVYAYTVGAVITGYGFGIGAEYTWGQYRGASVGRTAVNAGVDSSSHYAIGATYTMGPLVFGALFGQGFQGNGVAATGTGAARVFRDIDDRTHTIWGLGVAYNIAPGLVLYGIYNNINDENIPTSAPTNARYTGGSGTTLASFNGSNTRTINMGIVGIRLAF